MIIDLILDRRDNIRDGYQDTFSFNQFYRDCREYAQDFDDEIQWKIVDTLDVGTNKEVQDVLCEYIDANNYNPQIKEFIRSMNWIGE